MGGLGSTRWEYNRKKQVVENCLTLDAFTFLKDSAPSSGTASWTNRYTEEKSSSVAFEIDNYQCQIVFSYSYDSNDGRENVILPVRIDSAGSGFGGNQILFICPLVVNDEVCNRRVRELYKPLDVDVS